MVTVHAAVPDYYAVSGYCRLTMSPRQVGWRQYSREHGNNDMAVDLATAPYGRQMVAGTWRAMHSEMSGRRLTPLFVDSAPRQLPLLENTQQQLPTLRAGAASNSGRLRQFTWIYAADGFHRRHGLDTFFRCPRHHRRHRRGLIFSSESGPRFQRNL